MQRRRVILFIIASWSKFKYLPKIFLLCKLKINHFNFFKEKNNFQSKY